MERDKGKGGVERKGRKGGEMRGEEEEKKGSKRRRGERRREEGERRRDEGERRRKRLSHLLDEGEQQLLCAELLIPSLVLFSCQVSLGRLDQQVCPTAQRVAG